MTQYKSFHAIVKENMGENHSSKIEPNPSINECGDCTCVNGCARQIKNESLEKAAYTKCQEYGLIDKYGKPQTDAIEALIEFAQQQKPLAVCLPSKDDIFNWARTYKFETEKIGCLITGAEWAVKELRARLAAQNVFDAFNLVESIGKKLQSDSWVNYKDGKWYVHMKGHLTSKEFIDYLTEQSQQG